MKPEDYQLPYHTFYFLWPFLSFGYHFELKRVAGKKEIQALFITKLIVIAVYFALIICTYPLMTEPCLTACYSMMVATCVYMIVYSFCIFTFRNFQDHNA